MVRQSKGVLLWHSSICYWRVGRSLQTLCLSPLSVDVTEYLRWSILQGRELYFGLQFLASPWPGSCIWLRLCCFMPRVKTGSQTNLYRENTTSGAAIELRGWEWILLLQKENLPITAANPVPPAKDIPPWSTWPLRGSPSPGHKMAGLQQGKTRLK